MTDGIQTAGPAEARPADPAPADGRAVTAHTSAPGRTVFTECGNPDGWIASDLALDLPR